ncbi:MAG: flagellar motor switch protein FliM [Rhodospirillaceae bacterium]|nr:MAG: flagellar motor switch protein FliM [Rhodospirillaceae bacterium]
MVEPTDAESIETESTPSESGEDATLNEEDRLAAEWEAMADEDENESGEGEEGGNASASGTKTRVLNQDEIDSLLGFNEGDSLNNDTGIKAIINSPLVSYERLPMLEVIYDRLVRMLSTSLRNFTSDNVEVTLESITSVRFGDYLNSIPLPAMMGVYKAEEWDGYGLLTIDSALIYSIVDVLLGGRRGTTILRVEGRPYTTIERELIQHMLSIVLADLSAAFEPLSPVTFQLERLETNPRFATICRNANAAIHVVLRVDMEDRGGQMELVMPYATLEPIRELLLQMFLGEKFGRDTIWEEHLASELWRMDVEIEAVLDVVDVPLGEVMNLTVGKQILLNATPESSVQLRCSDVPLFVGKIGRKGGHMAVQIDSSKLSEKLANGEGT